MTTEAKPAPPVRKRFSATDWLAVFKGVVVGIGRHNHSMMAAGIAFFAMLALFPAIGATVSIYGYVSDPSVVLKDLEYIGSVLPEQVQEILLGRVERLISGERTALGLASLISVLLAVWSARSGVTATIAALEVICGKGAGRNFFVNLLVSYTLTLMLIVGAIIVLATVVILPTVMAFVPLGGWTGLWIDILRWSVSLIAVTLAIGLLYRYGPSRNKDRWPVLTIGCVLASLLWIAGSAMLSLYLGNFAHYDEIYGSLGAVVALLVWFYVSSLVMLVGAELNMQIEIAVQRRAPQEHPDPGRELAALPGRKNLTKTTTRSES